ncbi:hypothetical protein ACP70R_012082 [Stipagrostis hirtigluma subsp. patula]
MAASTSTTASSASVVELVAEPEHDTATSMHFDDGVAGGADFSWPAAEKMKSSLTSEEALRALCAKHGVPEGYTPLCANDIGWAPCTPPPEGSNAICVYAGALDAGMRLPLHDFYTRVLRHYGLAPSQLAPNAWRFMAAFVLLCEDAGVQPMLAVFRHLFALCAHRGVSTGWYYFLPSYRRRRLFVTTGLPTNEGWKSKFFFLKSPPATPCRWPMKWGKPSRAAVVQPVLTNAATTAVRKLEKKAGKDGIDLKKLLSQSQHRLPVGDIASLPPLATVKAEAGAESAPAPTRRGDTPASAVTPLPQQGVVVATAKGNSLATPPPVQSVVMTPTSPGFAPASARWSSPDGGERSAATQGVLDTMAGAFSMVQKTVAELEQKELELQAAKGEVSQLKVELEAAKAEHAAEVALLKEELRAAKAEVQAVKADGLRELMSAEQSMSRMLSERYAKGVRDMRDLALTLYPDVVDPSRLTPPVLSGSAPVGFRPQSPANQ